MKKMLLILITIGLLRPFIQSMEKKTDVTLLSNDGQKFTLKPSLAKHIGSPKEETTSSISLALEVPGSIVCSIVRLLKCLEFEDDQEGYTKKVFSVIKNTKNPDTLTELKKYCTELSLPACVSAGLQKRIEIGFSVGQLVDNEIELSIYPPGTLNLSGKMITSLVGLAQVPGINTVEALNLSDNLLEHLDPNALKACKQIKRLFLNNNLIRQLTKKDLATLPNLEQIHCTKNKIIRLEKETFAKKIDWIDLDNNPINYIEPKTFSGNKKKIFLKDNALLPLAIFELKKGQSKNELNL